MVKNYTINGWKNVDVLKEKKINKLIQNLKRKQTKNKSRKKCKPCEKKNVTKNR